MSTTNQTFPQGRASRTVPNFTDADFLKVVSSYHQQPDIAATVSITHQAGSLSFQHTMTPEQARAMAKDLMELADFADALNLEAAVLSAEAAS